ncbi:hypothetical protein SEA_BRAXOADDIE_84 [Rhodococcus phage Braxoaddie]|nr:hypothetical protein SEA_BRAXOADDIE_84 [Rhodococcus phage Braxoaddie]WNM67467.1 hypothetical protein SEA_POLYYUKI_83 [Rhodococcus phage Polyyuki]
MASKAQRRETIAPTFPYGSIDDIRKAHGEHYGGYFFSPDTMRSWKSRVLAELFGGRYFVTSERNYDDTARVYTVRHAHPNGDVRTATDPLTGERLSGYASASKARSVAQRLADRDPARSERTVTAHGDTWELTARVVDGYVIVTATPWTRDPARTWDRTRYPSYRDYVRSLGMPSAAQYRRAARDAAPSGALAIVERGTRYGHPRVYRLTPDAAPVSE